jgi:hypothetical protein
MQDCRPISQNGALKQRRLQLGSCSAVSNGDLNGRYGAIKSIAPNMKHDFKSITTSTFSVRISFPTAGALLLLERRVFEIHDEGCAFAQYTFVANRCIMLR